MKLELEQTKQQQKELRDTLIKNLYGNTGKLTTNQFNDLILVIFDNALILGYNERFHESKGSYIA